MLLLVGSAAEECAGLRGRWYLLTEVILEEEELFLIPVCNLTSSYKGLTLKGL